MRDASLLSVILFAALNVASKPTRSLVSCCVYAARIGEVDVQWSLNTSLRK